MREKLALGPQTLDSIRPQLGHSCVILSRLPPLSEPHLFSSNVEQPGSRGPSSSVSYAVGMEEGGSVDGFGGRAGSGAEPAQAPGSVFWTAGIERLGRLWAEGLSWQVEGHL